MWPHVLRTSMSTSFGLVGSPCFLDLPQRSAALMTIALRLGAILARDGSSLHAFASARALAFECRSVSVRFFLRPSSFLTFSVASSTSFASLALRAATAASVTFLLQATTWDHLRAQSAAVRRARPPPAWAEDATACQFFPWAVTARMRELSSVWVNSPDNTDEGSLWLTAKGSIVTEGGALVLGTLDCRCAVSLYCSSICFWCALQSSCCCLKTFSLEAALLLFWAWAARRDCSVLYWVCFTCIWNLSPAFSPAGTTTSTLCPPSGHLATNMSPPATPSGT
mmetsp:Transcript_6715/g.13015  ORF Transcript_6715/g.13015 Transcript_6715/m.13015 type:complete len:282 (-) Transcript_6715:986-1831(-)